MAKKRLSLLQVEFYTVIKQIIERQSVDNNDDPLILPCQWIFRRFSIVKLVKKVKAAIGKFSNAARRKERRCFAR